jgi:hypothetical protein
MQKAVRFLAFKNPVIVLLSPSLLLMHAVSNLQYLKVS